MNLINEKYIYILSQNYPNPFNPTTTIKYRAASNAKDQMSHVTLKVYYILGNEIATLVNEEYPAEEYEVKLNAANSPSGIYFYKLQSANFVETRNMILLR